MDTEAFRIAREQLLDLLSAAQELSVKILAEAGDLLVADEFSESADLVERAATSTREYFAENRVGDEVAAD